MQDQYIFNISLSVLNHLGRNLYRNFITILGEAISNSWDADAENVYIEIDRDNCCMSIIDDGTGMSSHDFQEKFLKIGYSKRKDGNFYSPTKKRPYIGRKGIGKLALLSCAKKIHIMTKKNDNNFTGGVIDNSELDEAIKDDLNSQEYTLGTVNRNFENKFNNISSGTLLYFEEIVPNLMYNTPDYMKMAIALYFKFSLYDNSFSIYVNGDRITEKHLKNLAEKTQFLWKINSCKDPIFNLMLNLENKNSLNSNFKINGYIASVKKPSDIKIRGTEEKVTIDLFVNGRLREKDILRHIPTARIVENYVYGQIHFDDLDTINSDDVFTTSREGIIENSDEFKKLLDEMKKIFQIIMNEWDDYRIKSRDDGDPDNTKYTKTERKAQELFNITVKDIEKDDKFISSGGEVEKWVQELSTEATFNIPSYTECYIAENLLRNYIVHTGTKLTPEAIQASQEWKTRENNSKNMANISYEIRISNNDIFYLDMDDLANLVDKAKDKNKDPGISRSAIVYKPIRNAVGHTSIITQDAKNHLTVEFKNIKARLVKLLKEVDNKN